MPRLTSYIDMYAGAKGLLSEWLDRAACGGRTDLMDPPLDQRTDARRYTALALCRSCPVRLDCQDWVLGQPGSFTPGWIVGGMTEGEIAKWRLAAGLIPEGYKRCSRCHLVKALDEFYPHALTLDGRQSACGECDRAIQRKRASHVQKGA
ncbi:WhiB family transcriptional regulator [Spirillospora sp. NBC_00431]